MSIVSMLGPLMLTVGGGVLYHLAAKSVPKHIDASLVLVGAYAAALCASAIAGAMLPQMSEPVSSARPWHPAILALGLGAFLIELGFVLTYRAGWPVSVASLLTSGLVAVLLVPIGMVVFGERLSAANGLGILLCLAGLALLRR